MSELSSLTNLTLYGLNLTSLDNFQLPTSLTWLNLNNNQLNSLDLSNLTSLTTLYIGGNQLTSLDGFVLPTSLTSLGLGLNPLLTSFDLSYLTNLNELVVQGGITEKFTSFSSNDYILPSNLTILDLANNLLTSFDGDGFPTSITRLSLNGNQLTSLDLSTLINLNWLNVNNYDGNNPITPSINDQILQQLDQNNINNGYFGSNNGRTSTSNSNHTNLINKGWSLQGVNI